MDLNLSFFKNLILLHLIIGLNYEHQLLMSIKVIKNVPKRKSYIFYFKDNSIRLMNTIKQLFDTILISGIYSPKIEGLYYFADAYLKLKLQGIFHCIVFIRLLIDYLTIYNAILYNVHNIQGELFIELTSFSQYYLNQKGQLSQPVSKISLLPLFLVFRYNLKNHYQSMFITYCLFLQSLNSYFIYNSSSYFYYYKSPNIFFNCFTFLLSDSLSYFTIFFIYSNKRADYSLILAF